jgi:hypothetical protein
MAIVAPPSSKAAARPMRADFVMTFSRADSPNHRKNIGQALAVPRVAMATNPAHVC